MTAADDEQARRAERSRAVALFRYSLIREAADPALSTRQRGRLVRGLAAREHAGPFGEPVRVSRPSLDRWIRAWRSGGFDALAPPARQVTLRTPAEVLGAGCGAEAGEPGPHRRAGRPDPAHQRRVVTRGADPATPLRAAGAHQPP